jgi:large subunit ribosomal protein L24
MEIRVDDIVKVTTGYDRGTQGKVLRVLRDENKVVVEGVNLVMRHVRPTKTNPRGGRLSKEMPVSLSNVMLICPACSKPSRTGVRYLDDGSKERWCKACGAGIGQIAPAKAKYAKKS